MISRILAMRVVRLLIGLLLFAGFATAVYLLAKPPAAVFVISKGGTYHGTWNSDDAAAPVILVKTKDPVIIENSTLRGRGNLIVCNTRHADITIRNTRGLGMNPNIAGKAAGRFASIERFDRVVIENCEMEGTAGIYLLDYAGKGTAKQSVRIVGNRSKNIDGRKSDGNDGYLNSAELVQFVQFDKVRHLAGVEIAWNEVVNEPGNSAVEDNISIYLSSGTPDSPIRIHDNFLRGAYPLHPQTDQYSGGGIMLGDGVGQVTSEDPSFVQAYDNVVLDTTNYGIAISAGHDNSFYRNRILSAGVLPDGRKIAAQNVGAYIWDSYKAGKDHFFNNSGSENVIGWAKGNERNDWWTPNATSWEKNVNWPGVGVVIGGPIPIKAYEAEEKLWRDRVKRAGVSVGLTNPTTAPSR